MALCCGIRANGVIADPDQRDAYWGPGVATAFVPNAFKRERAIDAQLEKLGIKPKDVRYVV